MDPLYLKIKFENDSVHLFLYPKSKKVKNINEELSRKASYEGNLVLGQNVVPDEAQPIEAFLPLIKSAADNVLVYRKVQNQCRIF